MVAKNSIPLTAERLRELLHYDPATGVFTRIISTGRSYRHKAGEIAGNDMGMGYLRIQIDRVGYRSHRLAWLYVYGVWPVNQIDHIDGNRMNNRIANLREATPAQNNQNRHKTNTRNISGLAGAHSRGKSKLWSSRIVVGGTCMHLGNFASPEEAHTAYLIAKAKYHEFSGLDLIPASPSPPGSS